ncbi:hypothetical protein PR048_006601 [Dryococelus australis]|uniref:Uncharacterized protein n=1 Tax=Dryococelus australis TaxID=614101 RepID=A0ABQ9ICM5_9NEOP|nr:hypothetical protein PR048_006601 [Dryococelus australis]
MYHEEDDLRRTSVCAAATNESARVLWRARPTSVSHTAAFSCELGEESWKITDPHILHTSQAPLSVVTRSLLFMSIGVNMHAFKTRPPGGGQAVSIALMMTPLRFAALFQPHLPSTRHSHYKLPRRHLAAVASGYNTTTALHPLRRACLLVLLPSQHFRLAQPRRLVMFPMPVFLLPSDQSSQYPVCMGGNQGIKCDYSHLSLDQIPPVRYVLEFSERPHAQWRSLVRYHTLSFTHTTNTSSAVVSQSPVVASLLHRCLSPYSTSLRLPHSTKHFYQQTTGPTIAAVFIVSYSVVGDLPGISQNAASNDETHFIHSNSIDNINKPAKSLASPAGRRRGCNASQVKLSIITRHPSGLPGRSGRVDGECVLDWRPGDVDWKRVRAATPCGWKTLGGAVNVNWRNKAWVWTKSGRGCVLRQKVAGAWRRPGPGNTATAHACRGADGILTVACQLSAGPLVLYAAAALGSPQSNISCIFLGRRFKSHRYIHASQRKHCTPAERLERRSEGSSGARVRVDLIVTALPCLKCAKNLLQANQVLFSAGSLAYFSTGNRVGRCRWSTGFLGDLPFPLPCFPALLHAHLASPSSALKTAMLRTTLNSPFHSTPVICDNFIVARETCTNPAVSQFVDRVPSRSLLTSQSVLSAIPTPRRERERESERRCTLGAHSRTLSGSHVVFKSNRRSEVYGTTPECKNGGKGKIPEKTRPPAALSGTMPMPGGSGALDGQRGGTSQPQDVAPSQQVEEMARAPRSIFESFVSGVTRQTLPRRLLSGAMPEETTGLAPRILGPYPDVSRRGRTSPRPRQTSPRQHELAVAATATSLAFHSHQAAECGTVQSLLAPVKIKRLIQVEQFKQVYSQIR